MPLHKTLTPPDIHIPYSFVYGNSSARTSATGFVSSDVGKFARQTDNNSIWMLTNVAPVWVEITSTSLVSLTNRIDLMCIKATAGTINVGQAVRAVGFDNITGSITVELAQADSVLTMPSIGIATATITDTSPDIVRVVGELQNVDTSSFLAGDQLFVSSASAGVLVSTPPSGPNVQQSVAQVITSDPLTGILLISTRMSVPLSDSSPQNISSSTPSSGTSPLIARDDHVHAHGDLSGGSLHATAIANGAAGFISGTDKAKLDGIEAGAQQVTFPHVAAALGGQAGSNANFVFKSDGYGSGNMVTDVLVIHNFVTVGLSGDVNFNNISDAVAFANSQGFSFADPYLIAVHPGTYVEPPITITDGLTISGGNGLVSSGVNVVAQNPLADLFTMNGGSLYGLTISGVSDPTHCLVRMVSSNPIAGGCLVENCSNGFVVESAANAIILQCGSLITGAGMAVGTIITVDGGILLCDQLTATALPAILSLYVGNPIQRAVHATNNAQVQISSSAFLIYANDSTQDAVFAENGSRINLFATQLTGNANAIHIGSSGSNTLIIVQGAIFLNNQINFNVESATGEIFAVCATDTDSDSLISGTQLTGIIQDLSGHHTHLKDGVIKYDSGREARLGAFAVSFGNTGLVSGGMVTAAAGLNVNVTGGSGWTRRDNPNNDFQDVSWDAVSSLALTASATNYIIYKDISNTIVSQTTLPTSSDIELAQVVTDISGIRFLHNTAVSIDSDHKNFIQYLYDTRKFRLKNGLLTTQGSTATKISISNGDYYRATALLSYPGVTDANFSYFYGFNGATEVPSQTDLDITNYDNAGTLTPMEDGYFRVDTVYITSDNRVEVIYGNVQYQTSDVASTNDGLPAFDVIAETAFVLATVIVQKAVGIFEISDRRTTDNGGGGGAGSPIVPIFHGQLLGLLDDDHPQYLLVNGTRAMSGSLDMGANDIIDVGTVDGVTVHAHANRHSPGGVDPLATGTPVSILIGASPSPGSAASYSLSDHQHGISVAVPTTIGTTNSSGGASSVSRSDHIHAHGAQTDSTLHAVATESTAGFMSAADKVVVDNAVTNTTHRSLRDLIHFIDDGPATGFASGAFREITPTANPFPTSVVWWVSSAKTAKIVEKLITRNANQIPTTIVWNMYASDGVTIIQSVTDAITYSGIIETSRTRTIT